MKKTSPPASTVSADAGPGRSEPRIGLLAAHELRRLVETDPVLACNVLARAESAIVGRTAQAASYSLLSDGHTTEGHVEGATAFLYSQMQGTVVVHISPPGPISITDGEIWLAHDGLPSGLISGIDPLRPGRPSDYVRIDGLDIDALAPGGIEQVESMDMLNPARAPRGPGLKTLHEELVTFLRYPVLSIPFGTFAHEIRMRAAAVITDAVHAGRRDGPHPDE